MLLSLLTITISIILAAAQAWKPTIYMTHHTTRIASARLAVNLTSAANCVLRLFNYQCA